ILDDSKLRSAKRNKRPSTVGHEFRESINTLITRLNSRQQLYVRCIKPNESNNDEQCFNVEKVRHQIKYLGLVEHGKICQASLWRQYRYEDFVRRFRMFSDEKQLIISRKNHEDLRASYQLVCKTILEKLSNIVVEDDFNCSADNKNSNNKKFAFGRTILFVRDPKIVESLEMKRFEYLQHCVVQVQTLGRRFLARKRFKRIELTKLAFELFCQRKKLGIIGKFLDKFEHRYFDQYMFSCLHRPSRYLEYGELLAIRYRNKITSRLLQDNVHNILLPEMIDYFNHWLIIMKFPRSYWSEKVLRIEAQTIFTGNKCEWGFSRKKWLGNYLADDGEHPDHIDGYDEYFNHNDLGKIIFAAKIIAPKSSTKEYGLIMNGLAIFKLNFKHKTFYEWIQLKEIQAVSVSTGSDQLVVLHGHDSDLVFAFDCCTKQKSKKTIDLMTTSDQNNKVGEFVTLLWQRIESLKINFQSDSMEFRWKNKRKTVRPIEWNSPEFEQIVAADDGHRPGSMTCYFREIFRILISIKDELSGKSKSDEENRQRQRENNFQKISTTRYIFTYE
ncbi:myosin-like protein, partial [Euroglyphus maynei]